MRHSSDFESSVDSRDRNDDHVSETTEDAAEYLGDDEWHGNPADLGRIPPADLDDHVYLLDPYKQGTSRISHLWRQHLGDDHDTIAAAIGTLLGTQDWANLVGVAPGLNVVRTKLRRGDDIVVVYMIHLVYSNDNGNAQYAHAADALGACNLAKVTVIEEIRGDSTEIYAIGRVIIISKGVTGLGDILQASVRWDSICKSMNSIWAHDYHPALVDAVSEAVSAVYECNKAKSIAFKRCKAAEKQAEEVCKAEIEKGNRVDIYLTAILKLTREQRAAAERAYRDSISTLCAVCGSVTDLRCGECRMMLYCSDVCRHIGWKDHGHRASCRLRRRLIKRGAAAIAAAPAAAAADTAADDDAEDSDVQLQPVGHDE